MTDTKTPVQFPHIQKAYEAVKAAAPAARSVEWRRKTLQQIKKMITENQDRISQALKQDLAQTDFVCACVEAQGCLAEVDYALDHLDEWVKPKSVSTPLTLLPGSSFIQREPYGSVLIVAPWNYPFALCIKPLISAVAAGNTALIKPSEVSANTSKLVAGLIPRYIDSGVAVVEGAVAETTALLALRWDMILYTGSTAVGKIVARAAAEHLTPVVLELGGKCPAVVTSDADISNAAKRIVWGKFTLNYGQTCLAPDYILTTPDIVDKLMAEVKKTITNFYTDKPETSLDVSRIINVNHARRLAALLDDSSIEVVTGGQVDVDSKYIAPTVVKAKPDSKCMRDEIFGPILPVITVNNVDEAINFINQREKPLALYVFSSKSAIQQRFLDETSSGGVCLNDVSVHYTNHELPFGGVGHSGCGSYHGEYGFDAFSHKRSVYKRYGADLPARFPPYTKGKLATLKFVQGLKFGGFKTVAKLIALGLVAYALYRFFPQLQSLVCRH